MAVWRVVSKTAPLECGDSICVIDQQHTKPVKCKVPSTPLEVISVLEPFKEEELICRRVVMVAMFSVLSVFDCRARLKSVHTA